MVFSSYLFLFQFLPAALAIYYAVRGRARHLALTALSYIFYGWSNPWFALVLAGTTLVDYVAALAIAGKVPWSGGEAPQLAVGGRRTRRQKAALLVSVACNLGVLTGFKYFSFFATSATSIATFLGMHVGVGHSIMRVALPLGISFYTFQSLSYTIDVYRGHARANRSLLDLACFVSMFPQLVAGPIVRYSELADQLAARTHTLEKFARGAAFVSLGLAKKVLLANPSGAVADALFGTPGIGAGDAWYGAVAYAFQIYFDFSGYSDMAVGLGLMLGFMFPRNFNSPYRATSITDFWRRWHISLSTWLRDYLYIPLGGNRSGRFRTCLNIAIVMLLGGLWHGAAWTFVVWGAIHGVLLIVERVSGSRDDFSALARPARVMATFAIVTIAWVFFRSPDLRSSLDYCRAMFGCGHPAAAAPLMRGLIYQPYYVLTMLVCAFLTWLSPQTWDFTRSLPAWKIAWAILLFWLSVAVLTTQSYNPFIYFHF